MLDHSKLVDAVSVQLREVELKFADGKIPPADFFQTCFLCIKSWKLKAFNEEIQLVSNSSDKAIKLFAESDINQINKALEHFLKSKSYLSFKELYLFIWEGNTQFPFVSFDKQTKRKFPFDPAIHIFGKQDLYKAVHKAGKTKLENLNSWLTDYLATLEQAEEIIEIEEEPDLNVWTATEEAFLFNGIPEFPAQILNRRGQYFFGDYYYQRKFDSSLLDLVNSGKSILLYGVQLSGKSRAIWELVQKAKNKSTQSYIVPNPEISIKKWLASLDNSEKCVFILDNIAEYFKSENIATNELNSFINDALNQGHQFILSAEDGIEWNSLKDFLAEDVRSKLDLIEVPQLAGDQIQDFQMEVNQRLDFNALEWGVKERKESAIGALFLDLSAIKKWFSLDPETQEDPRKELFLRRVLKAMKLMHFAFNFEVKPGFFNEKKVKAFSERLHGRKISVKKWEEAVKALLELPNAFITRNKDTLRIETVYLERSILPDLNFFQAEREIKHHFPIQDERKEEGFFTHPWLYGSRIYASNSFEDAHEVYQNMGANGVKRSLNIFRALINKADSSETCLPVVADLEKSGFKIDLPILYSILSKAKDWEKAASIINIWEEQALAPSIPFVKKALALCPDFKAVLKIDAIARSRAWLLSKEDMIQSISKVENFEDAKAYMDLVLNAETEVPEEVLVYSINCSPEIEASKNLVKLWENNQNKISQKTIRALVRQSNNLNEALGYIKALKDLNETLNINDWKSVFDAEGEEQELSLAFNEFSNSKIIGDNLLFNTLLAKSKSVTLSDAIVELMHEHKIELDIDGLNAIIEKQNDYTSAFQKLKELQKSTRRPNRKTYELLLAKADEKQLVDSVLTQMKEAKLAPSLFVYQRQFETMPTENWQDSVKLFRKLKEKNLELPLNIYNSVILSLKGNEQNFVDQCIRLYPTTLGDKDYHEIFKGILNRIDAESFIKKAEGFICRSDKSIKPFVEALINIENAELANYLLSKLLVKADDFMQLKAKIRSLKS